MSNKKSMIKQFFIETPVFDDGNKEKFSDFEITKPKGNFVKTEKVNQEIEADIYKVNLKNYYKIFFRKNQQQIGMVELDKTTNPVVLFPTVIGIAVRRHFQGKGYSKVFYSWLINYYGGIISDETLTGEDGHGSFQLWQWISKTYPTYIWKSKEKAIIPVTGGITDKMMDKKKDHFMASREPVDYKAYNAKFAPQFNKPELKPVAKLTEMPAFNDAHLSMGKKTKHDDEFNQETYDSMTNLVAKQIFKDYSVELYEEVEKCFVFALSRTKKIIGRLNADNKGDFPTVDFIFVFEQFQGKGIGIQMYKILVENIGGVYSDRTLTGSNGGGSFAAWVKLGTMFHPYIKRKLKGSDQTEIVPVKGFTSDMMGNPDVRFLVTNKPLDVGQNPAHADNLSKDKALAEVELMQHKGQSDIDSSDPNEWDFVSGQKLIEKKVAPGIIFLKMKISHANDVKYALKDAKTGKIISGMRAKIDPNDYKVDPNEAQISSVVTGEQYRNKGWGKLLYKLVLDTEKTIVSDYQIYPGAAAIWSKYLPTIANVYNYNEDGELEPFDFAKGTSKAGIYDYFIASKKKLL